MGTPHNKQVGKSMLVIATKNDMMVSDSYDVDYQDQGVRLLRQKAKAKLGLNLDTNWIFDILAEPPENYPTSFAFFPGRGKY
jgi:hypothetical protein